MNKLFLDTSYAIALAPKKDVSHQQAKALAFNIKNSNISVLTTQAIQLEIGNALAKLKYRPFAVSLLENFESDPNIEIVSITGILFEKAFELFRNRTDKEWGIVDCISFVTMREQEITDALTADEHFVQAGFRALLREK